MGPQLFVIALFVVAIAYFTRSFWAPLLRGYFGTMSTTPKPWSNQDITALQGEVEGIQATLSELRERANTAAEEIRREGARVTRNSEELSSVRGTISGLETRLTLVQDALEKQISSLQQQVENLQDLVAIILQQQVAATAIPPAEPQVTEPPAQEPQEEGPLQQFFTEPSSEPQEPTTEPSPAPQEQTEEQPTTTAV